MIFSTKPLATAMLAAALLGAGLSNVGTARADESADTGLLDAEATDVTVKAPKEGAIAPDVAAASAHTATMNTASDGLTAVDDLPAAPIGKAEGGAVMAKTSMPAAPQAVNDSIENASGERLAEAVGHYARARSLLIAAIREFDLGYKKAKPDALLNSKLFRDTLADRAEELERVLDPQPRITRGGVRYNPDPRLLSEADRSK